MNHEAEAGWERIATNRLRRVIESPSGLVTIETVSIKSRLRKILEEYPDDALRRRRAGYVGVEIDLLDAEKQFISRIHIPNANIIRIDLYPDQGKGFEVLDSPDALVSLQYNQGAIKNCTLQPDISYVEVSDPHLEGSDWRQTLPLLLNYIRTATQGDLNDISTYNEDELTDFIKDNLLSRSHSLVSIAGQISDQLIAHILSSIPLEDQDETNGLLASINLRDFLDKGLLMSLINRPIDVNNIGDMLLSSDRYLDRELEFAIWMIESDPVYQTAFLVLEDFSEEGFAYHQVEKDFDGSQVLPTNPNSLFGANIDVYGNKFLATKAGDSIVIECKRSGKQGGWRASFPLTIPADQIVNTGTNPEGDFRQVRSLLNFSLKEQKK